MTAWQAFVQAQREIWRRRGIIGILYVVNVITAAVLTLPFVGRLDRLAKTALADKLIDGFSLDYAQDFFYRYADSLQALFSIALGLGVLYLILNTFFAGGILHVLAREDHFRLRAFFAGCGTYFGRFLRLFLLSLLVLAILFLIYLLAVILPVGGMAKKFHPDSQFQTYLLIGVGGLLFLGFWNMLFDYAKIAVLAGERKSAFKGFFTGLGFSLRYFMQTVGLYFLNYLILILLFVLYLGIENLFRNTTAASTYGLLAIQQLFILSRLWMKTSFFSSQQLFYFDRRPEQAPQPVLIV